MTSEISSNLPGGPLATRPLHFFFLCDCSGSMAEHGKIQSLNHAIKEVIPHMQEEAAKNPNAQVLVRVLKFSSGAQWHLASPTPVEKFTWTQDLSAGGVTDMGRAFTMLAEQLKMPPMEQRALPPVAVLISDGQPTDDITVGLKAIDDQPWGKKIVRIAIAIGDDADIVVLKKYLRGSERILYAKNPDKLKEWIRWTSTLISEVARSKGNTESGVPLHTQDPSAKQGPASADDVW